MRVKWGIQMPLRTQQWIQADTPQRQQRGITVQGDISQTAAQCHLEVPQATVRGSEGRNKTREKQPKVGSCAGVTHISAGVLSGYQMVRGDICLDKHMHALRSSPGEKKATCHCDCWFCSHNITNPSLILFGKKKRKKSDATENWSKNVFTRADPAC